MKKFADGGFSAAQEEFLGGADRTDPYILARMRAAVPDEKIKESVVEESSKDLDPYGAASKKPTAVEKTVVKTKVTPSSKIEPEWDDNKTALPTKVKAASPDKKTESKGEEKSFLKGTKGYKNFGDLFKSMRESAGITSYNSGGKVKSASARADGCAIRGKTRA